MDQRYKKKHVKGKRWKARRRKTRIWSRREGDSVVYMHRNRRNGKIYIGYTTRSCFERWTYSEYEKNGVNSYIYRALMKEKELYEQSGIRSTDRLVGFESRILVDGLSAEQAPEVEEATIAFFKRKGCELYNGTDGGDAPPIMRGEDHPMKRPEVAAKVSETMTGRTLSEEHRLNIGEALKEYYENHPDAMKGENNPMYGKHHSEETREAMSEALKEYYENHPEARGAAREAKRDKMRPVEAVNPKTGERVHYFESTHDAKRAGFDRRHINSCCNEKQKTHKGLIWRFVKDE